MRLIVNADDFGYTRAVTYGILDAFKKGIVTSTTMMCNSPQIDMAVDIAKQNPELGVGIHLVLTCGKPICDNVHSLIDDNGNFHNQRDIFSYAKEEDIERELTDQIEKFYSTGLTPTHLDSHHNVHGNELVLPIAIRLAGKYGLPLRRANNETIVDDLYGSVLRTNLMLREFYGDGVSFETLEKQLAKVAEQEQTVEINCHPGYIDESLTLQSSYVQNRIQELSILTSTRIKEAVNKLNIKLMSYRELEVANHSNFAK
jgi:chitin disaccharide deacetylase